MKIGILQTGTSPDQIRSEHGDYNDLFERLLSRRGFEFTTYAVLDNEFPPSIDAQDGWLITGSRFAAYEDHNWIPPLEEFLRQAYAAGIPIVGVCFGHQILAQALGGVVEKYAGGWSVGATEYQSQDPACQPHSFTLMAWHQDQITQLPADAEVLASSAYCKYAMLAYGDRALTIQPHPEFNKNFMQALLDARREVLPRKIAEQAEQGLGTELQAQSIVDRFELFFKMQRGGSS